MGFGQLTSQKNESEEFISITLFTHGRDWGQEEKGTTEDEMAGWHH